MRVLVTGFAGYLGPHVVRLLKAHGHYVIGLDTGWFLPSYAELPVWPDVALFRDIRWAYPDLDPDVDAVVHLAGLSNDPLGEMDPSLTANINAVGTYKFLRPGRRHVIASSCSVYGTAVNATEETPPAPLTNYALAKQSVDAFVTGERDVVSLRFGTLYGYSPGHRLDLVVNRMVYDATRARGVTVYGNAARPLTHVEDAARAIVQAVESPLMRGIYNVAHENWLMQPLGVAVRSAVARHFSLPSNAISLVFKPGDADARDYSAWGDKLLATGFTFEHSVQEALPELIDKTLQLRGPMDRYIRLNVIRDLIDSGRLSPDLKESIA